MPELLANARRAWALSWSLKFLTLTFTADDPAGANTPAGEALRRKELALLVRWLRARGGCEYLKVAETHKNGRVHLHLLASMPWVAQAELQERWGARVDIRPMFAKCERCWPGREGSDAAKASARVTVRAGGVIRCANGHTMERDQFFSRAGTGAAWEVAKYLTKDKLGRMSRSREWVKAVSPPAIVGECDDCGQEHETEFMGSGLGLVDGDGEAPALLVDVSGRHPHVTNRWIGVQIGVLNVPEGGVSCECFAAKGSAVAALSP